MEMSEKREHEIVAELLPFYADKALGEESGKLVQDHLQNCEECRRMLDAMERELPGEHMPRSGHDLKVEQAFRKTRRGIAGRMVSLVLVLVLLLGTAGLIRNQVRGEGICFGNLRELRQASDLMEVWKRQGGAAAVKKMNPYRQYETLRTLDDGQDYLKGGHTWNELVEEQTSLEDGTWGGTPVVLRHERRGVQLTVGGKDYMLSPRANEFGDIVGRVPGASATEEETLAFWYDVMTDSSVYWMVPEELYLEVLAAYGNLDTDSCFSTFAGEGEEICGYPVDCEIRSISGESGVYYYRESDARHALGDAAADLDVGFPAGLFLHTDAVEYAELPEFFRLARETDLMPLSAYEEYIGTADQIDAWFRDYRAFYEDMGEEGFAKQWRRQLSEGLDALEAEGNCLMDYRYLGCYYDERREEWSVCYRVSFSNGYTGKVWLNADAGKIYLNNVSALDSSNPEPGISLWEIELFGFEDIPAEEDVFFRRISELLWHEEW